MSYEADCSSYSTLWGGEVVCGWCCRPHPSPLPAIETARRLRVTPGAGWPSNSAPLATNSSTMVPFTPDRFARAECRPDILSIVD